MNKNKGNESQMEDQEKKKQGKKTNNAVSELVYDKLEPRLRQLDELVARQNQTDEMMAFLRDLREEISALRFENREMAKAHSDLKLEVGQLKDKFEAIELQNIKSDRMMRQNALVIHGIDVNISDDQLTDKVKSELHVTAEDHVTEITRLGKVDSSRRPVKITFTTLSWQRKLHFLKFNMNLKAQNSTLRIDTDKSYIDGKMNKALNNKKWELLQLNQSITYKIKWNKLYGSDRSVHKYDFLNDQVHSE